MSKRISTTAAVGGAILGLAAVAAAGAEVLIGTYSRNGSEGIYRASFDPAAGTLGQPALAVRADNPSFLAWHPDGRHLYAVSEIATFQGKPGGAVASYERDVATGVLRELNRQPTGGAAPCHLIVDPPGRRVIVANYSDGNVAVFPIAADGRLEPLAQRIQHEGAGPNAARQKSPHAHGVTLDATGRFAIVPDLGIDQLRIYRLAAEGVRLEPNDPPFAATAPGAGPRHFAFHPNGKFGWSINELDSTVTAFAWDAAAGRLTAAGVFSTLPEGCTNRNTTAEIVLHPSGRFLYGSNRGHDSIAVFAVDAGKGTLTPLQHQPTGGKSPRNFTLDPTGRFLLAANQDSGNILVFRIDPDTGRLAPAGSEIKVPMPVCVLFGPS